jgi:hypothetical protein
MVLLLLVLPRAALAAVSMVQQQQQQQLNRLHGEVSCQHCQWLLAMLHTLVCRPGRGCMYGAA